jgi:hypothetical protein
MVKKKKLTKADLKKFNINRHWLRHPINQAVLLTNGARYVAETGAAHWLLDEIALFQRDNDKGARDGYEVWVLKVNPDQTAMLKCEDHHGNVFFSKEIEHTDFPLPEITLWYSNNVIHLPNEH